MKLIRTLFSLWLRILDIENDADANPESDQRRMGTSSFIWKESYVESFYHDWLNL